MVIIEGTHINDCPRAYIKPESMHVIEITVAGRIIDSAGGAIFGPNASRWPAWYVDALSVIDHARNAYEEARLNGRD